MKPKSELVDRGFKKIEKYTYVNPKDTLALGNIPLNKIKYYTDNNKFNEVQISFSSENYERIYQFISKRYGRHTSTSKSLLTDDEVNYNWDLSTVEIQLNVMNTLNIEYLGAAEESGGM